VSLSPSLSPSISPSFSPSISPGYQAYSRGDYINLPTNDADLTTIYSEQDVIDVGTSNDVRVGVDGTNFMVHEFKDYVGLAFNAGLNLEVRSSLAPSSSTVYLQIFNRTSSTWETVASNNTASEDTDFTLSPNIMDLTNYKDDDLVISCRVYQEVV
jgi:hypothetical protein